MVGERHFQINQSRPLNTDPAIKGSGSVFGQRVEKQQSTSKYTRSYFRARDVFSLSIAGDGIWPGAV